MLGQIGVNRWDFRYCTFDTLSVTPGVSIVPGASDVEGSWTEIAGDADITQDIFMFTVWVAGGATNGQAKSHLLDIGIDPAGGTSYVAVISNICCGQSAPIASGGGGGYAFLFPLFIKAGSAVAVRIQGSNATAGTVVVGATFYGQPSRPELVRVGQYTETIGAITNSEGVSVPNGVSSAEGAWVSLGTLTRGCWWFQLCPQFSDNSLLNDAFHFDLAYGDSSNKHFIIESLYFQTGAGETMAFSVGSLEFLQSFADLPAGTELWCRSKSVGAAVQGVNVTVIGVGG